MRVRARLLTAICGVLLTQPAWGQYLRGYVFVGPVPNNGASSGQATFGILPPAPTALQPASTTLFSFGGGFEQRFGKYAGAGLDLASLIPTMGKVFSNSVGTVSPNVFVHLPRADGQGSPWDLYATGGYTALFRDFGANGVNGGGGLNYWFRERMGVNLEFRFVKVFGANPPTPGTDFYAVRFGMTFR